MIKDKATVISWYGYEPMLAPNAVGLGLAALLLILHTGLGVYYRQWWMFVTWFIGIAFTIVGYVFRVCAALDYFDATGYKVQYAFFIIVPAFIMAGVYYQMTKLLTIWGTKYVYFKPMFYTGTFIGSDVLSILVQAAGGGAATQNDSNVANIGRWIIFGGIAVQVVSMAWFLSLFTILVLKVRKLPDDQFEPQFAHIRRRPLFKYLIPAIYICWAFVYARSIYRLIEMAQGWRGHLASHEVYFLVLEGLMMMLAMYTLTIIYPGVCYGREMIPVIGLHSKKYLTSKGQVDPDEKELVDVETESRQYGRNGYDF